MLDGKICIVGGGIVGASTAYYLTKAGHREVTLRLWRWLMLPAGEQEDSWPWTGVTARTHGSSQGRSG